MLSILLCPLRQQFQSPGKSNNCSHVLYYFCTQSKPSQDLHITEPDIQYRLCAYQKEKLLESPEIQQKALFHNIKNVRNRIKEKGGACIMYDF